MVITSVLKSQVAMKTKLIQQSTEYLVCVPVYLINAAKISDPCVVTLIMRVLLKKLVFDNLPSRALPAIERCYRMGLTVLLNLIKSIPCCES